MVLNAEFLRQNRGANRVNSTITLKAAIRLRPIISVLMMPLMVMAKVSVKRPKRTTAPLVMRRKFCSLTLGLTNFL